MSRAFRKTAAGLPKEGFVTVGVVCMLVGLVCAAALIYQVAAGNTVNWALAPLAISSFCLGLGFLWVGALADWLRARVLLLQELEDERQKREHDKAS